MRGRIVVHPPPPLRQLTHMTERDKTVRVRRPGERVEDADLRTTTPAERLGMMWQLALDAWAFKGEPVESEFERYVVRVVRMKNDDS